LTNNPESMLRFWQQDVGLPFDHVPPVTRLQCPGDAGSVR
jgi:hypothetical protein